MDKVHDNTIAIKQYFASLSSKDVKALLASDGMLLRYLDDTRRNHPEICVVALGQNLASGKYLGEEILQQIILYKEIFRQGISDNIWGKENICIYFKYLIFRQLPYVLPFMFRQHDILSEELFWLNENIIFYDQLGNTHLTLLVKYASALDDISSSTLENDISFKALLFYLVQFDPELIYRKETLLFLLYLPENIFKKYMLLLPKFSKDVCEIRAAFNKKTLSVESRFSDFKQALYFGDIRHMQIMMLVGDVSKYECVFPENARLYAESELDRYLESILPTKDATLSKALLLEYCSQNIQDQQFFAKPTQYDYLAKDEADLMEIVRAIDTNDYDQDNNLRR